MTMSILDEIIASKRAEVATARRRLPRDELEAQAASAPPVRDFRAALEGPGPIQLIAEVKKASPSARVIRADFDPIAIARAYQRHGAACLSVLTDAPEREPLNYFGGAAPYPWSSLREPGDAAGSWSPAGRTPPAETTPAAEAQPTITIRAGQWRSSLPASRPGGGRPAPPLTVANGT